MSGSLSDDAIVRGIADDLSVGLWVARAPNGEFVYANRAFAEIMGQTGRGDCQVGSYSEAYGILTRDGRPYPEDRLPFVLALQQRQRVVVDDITIRRPDRSQVHVRAFANPVMVPDTNEISHIVIAFFDITREVEADRRLSRAQRLEAVGTLAGGIAHDFNNLIFGIKLLATELAIGEDNPKKRSALALIDDITERSALLTRSLLGFAGRSPSRPVPVALDDILVAMEELLVRTMAGVTITFALEAIDRGYVVADRSQLEQVVMNLVANARDALRSSTGGRVELRTRTVGAHVILEVIDDGPGIPAEIRDRVFEPYFTTKTQGGDRGTGLGLATVFGIVESHGGTIEITSGLGDHGTTMRISLPAATNRPSSPVIVQAPVRTAGSGGRILVVDDDAIVRRALVMALGNLGYTPVEAASGAEALEIYEREKASLRGVLLDMIMPGMNGAATFAGLRAIDPQVAVVLVSGHTTTTEVDALLADGVRGFIAKPCTPEALAEALEQMLPATA